MRPACDSLGGQERTTTPASAPPPPASAHPPDLKDSNTSQSREPLTGGGAAYAPQPSAGRSKSGAAQRLQSRRGMWLFSLLWSSGTWQTWKPAGLSRALPLQLQRDGAGMGAVPESSAPPLGFFLGIWFRCLSTHQEFKRFLQKGDATVP